MLQFRRPLERQLRYLCFTAGGRDLDQWPRIHSKSRCRVLPCQQVSITHPGGFSRTQRTNYSAPFCRSLSTFIILLHSADTLAEGLL